MCTSFKLGCWQLLRASEEDHGLQANCQPDLDTDQEYQDHAGGRAVSSESVETESVTLKKRQIPKTLVYIIFFFFCLVLVLIYKWLSLLSGWVLSRVRILATLWTIAYQAPCPHEAPRQEYWSKGLLFPSLWGIIL